MLAIAVNKRDYDRADNDTDYQNSRRLKQRQDPFDAVAPLLLGQCCGRFQHLRKTARPLPNPNKVDQGLVKNPVILECHAERTAAPHRPLHLHKATLEALHPKRVARQRQTLNERDPVL